MRTYLSAVLLLALGSTTFAGDLPTNTNIECQFRTPARKKAGRLRCHAVANFHFQGGADDHLLLNCPGHGQDTIVYNGDAEFDISDEVAHITPVGDVALPDLVLPSVAFGCSQTPRVFKAALALTEDAPYFGRKLFGRCKVVSAGCGAEPTE